MLTDSGFKLEYQKEKAFDGVDFEIGYKLPITFSTAKLYGGYYYFDESGLGEVGYKDITGPRVRAEFAFDSTHNSYIPNNSKITLGTEYQSDKVNGDQIFAIAKFTYQFGSKDNNYQSNKNSDLRNRMTEFAVRDIDIQSNNKIFDVDAIISIDDHDFDSLLVVTANDDFVDKINNANANALIILDGKDGEFQVNNQSIHLKPNQYIASNQVVDVKAIDGSAKTQHHFNSSRAKFNVDNTLNSNEENDLANQEDRLTLFNLDDNTTLKGVDIKNHNLVTVHFSSKNSIIKSQGKSNITIDDVNLIDERPMSGEDYLDSVNVHYAPAIAIFDSQNVTIKNISTRGFEAAIRIQRSRAVNVDNAKMDYFYDFNRGNYGIYTAFSENVSLNNITIENHQLSLAANTVENSFTLKNTHIKGDDSFFFIVNIDELQMDNVVIDQVNMDFNFLLINIDNANINNSALGAQTESSRNLGYIVINNLSGTNNSGNACQKLADSAINASKFECN